MVLKSTSWARKKCRRTHRKIPKPTFLSPNSTLWGKSPKSAAKRTIADKDICLTNRIHVCWSLLPFRLVTFLLNPTNPDAQVPQNGLLLLPSRFSSKADAPDQSPKVCLPSMGRIFQSYWDLPDITASPSEYADISFEDDLKEVTGLRHEA